MDGVFHQERYPCQKSNHPLLLVDPPTMYFPVTHTAKSLNCSPRRLLARASKIDLM